MDRAGLQALCKRHGLPARGSNADLLARVDAALRRAAAGAEEVVAGVPVRKGSLKHEAKKVSFVVEEATVRRLRSQAISSSVVAGARGKSAQAGSVEVGADVPLRQSRRKSLGADVPLKRPRRNSLGADVPVRRSRRNSLMDETQDCELRSQVIWSLDVAKTGGNSAQAGSVEVGADVPLRRSRRNSLSAAKSEEVGVAVFVDKKRKRKNQESDEGVTVNAQVGASSRVTRRSSLAGAAAVLPPAVEKKRGRGEAAGVQKSAQVEVPARITRSHSIAPVVMSPTVVEHKRRRKTGDAQTNVELPMVSDVPRNDAPVTRSLRNRVVQVNNSVVDANKPATKGPARGRRRKSNVSELHEKEKDVEEQLVVKQPVRRSSCKSVLPDMLENNIQSGKSQDNEKEQKLQEPVRRSRRSVATVLLEEQNSGLHEEKLSKNHLRRSTHKSVALNAVEKMSMDDTEIVVQSTTSEGMSSKRRRTIAPEETRSLKEASDDMIIREATTGTQKATHEYNKISSRIQEICQVIATRDEFSSGPLRVTITPTNEICTQQSVHEVVPGSESGDNTKESLKKSKQPQEHCDIQAVDSHLSERSGELDQSSCIAVLVPHNCVVSEDNTLMSKDDLSVNFTVGDREEQSLVSREGIAGLGGNGSESGEKNLGDIMSTGLHAKSLQYDIGIVAEETGKGDLEKSSLCSAAPKCEHERGLREEIVLPSKTMGSVPNAEQLPFGLESLFSQESIDEPVGYGAHSSATTHTENGFGESKDCHVKSAPEKTHVSEPFSHHGTEGISKNDDRMDTSQQDNGMEGLPEDIVLPSKTIGSLPTAEQSPSGLESLFSQESIDESVGYGAHASATTHTENGFGESKDCQVKSAPEKTHVSEPFSHHDTEEGISKNDDCMDTSQQDNKMEDATENPSITLPTPGYKYEGALSEEAVHTMEYTGTCSSNPRKLMELQSLFSKENIKESYPHDGLAFPSPEKPGNDSINIEVKVHHSSNSNLSQLGSTDLLDEPIRCSNTEVLHQGHNHKDRSNEDRIEQVASEPCINGDDIEEAAAAAATKCIENGVVLLPCEGRSNLNDTQLNPKLESPDIMESGLNCDKDARNTLDNGSAVAVVSKNTPSGSGYYEHNAYQVSDICAMSEAALIGVLETRIDVETSSLLDEQLIPEMNGDEVEKHSLLCGADTSRILGTGSLMSNTSLLPKESHAICCQELELPNGLSLFKFAEESAICQYASVPGSGPCQQRVNESTSMQAIYNIETLKQHREEYNQNNEDQITHCIPASSVPEAAAIEQSETEIGLIPAAEASVLPLPDEQRNNKLEGNEVDEHSCSYDTEFLNREASDLKKDDCMDLCSEDNHPNDLPAPRSPQQFSYFQNDNDSGSVGICQSSRRRGINDELRAKRQNFKVSSTVKGSCIAKSASHLKRGDSLSQSAIALHRNRGNTTAVKVGHPVKPNADRSVAKDSSRRGMQPISRGPRDILSQSGLALHRNRKCTTVAVKTGRVFVQHFFDEAAVGVIQPNNVRIVVEIDFCYASG